MEVLGVVTRGTNLLGFPGRSIQPITEKLMNEKNNEKYNYKFIFLLLTQIRLLINLVIDLAVNIY